MFAVAVGPARCCAFSQVIATRGFCGVDEGRVRGARILMAICESFNNV